ncbi:acyl-coenzyme A synthetase/AMP-(fatty) acid ligase/peptidoglycan/LPS O-acetylase OafA/YrhL [Aeromicrobium panaciterrae]|uniref:Acyl-coenzyme A synthetase/AMP-(Fatty) acid ligase/peptidoglycan/LPS O-acetylase OafA/YrhL n=1 Tax=Aeromicrobium panaciterrae TaxID=363861 RepID=A0ABU1UL14_9ACTN|nr:AMP-binding protein [Aeromicrobium panaciterrae]MDR7085866.1 acyl-coenzyme A synthetase/AMP-(fatty) acid ligase/peptidoglycan/LPS O-acetylase OafA/YrhL [Aeromicrobium panaciterrae]
MITTSNAFGTLRANGDRPALITPGNTVTFAELGDRIDAVGDVLAGEKRLVVVGGANTPEALTAYLAAMSHGHAVLLVPGDSPVNLDSIVDAYDPDVVFDPAHGSFVERREDSRHELHPDLALLMSTSGTTGSPKLVRLSLDNVVSNARCIAEYLDIREGDRAITTLPMHYCYGLSVVNSHVLSGAGLVITDLSVVDECLWTLAAEEQATSFAGVPYTFDLLDSTDFADRDLPSLRHVTQAGGRLAPERIAAYAELGRERGWDFYAMYGQTEATARMAYLPSDLALERPAALGVPVPGGSFRLAHVPESTDDAVGELVYSGPNVMMGYATSQADLANGPELSELRTGDLARQHADGSYEWVGRRSRISKVFGLRIDLDEVECALLGEELSARCVSVGDRVHAFVDWHADVAHARTVVAQRCGLPEHVVSVGRLRDMPRTSNGKTDYAALGRQARLLDSAGTPARASDKCRSRLDVVRDMYAELLARPDAAPGDSFTSLRGDSLSYVELSTKLAGEGIDLPSDWHRRTIAELVQAPSRRRRGTRVEMSILLRAVAILLIVGTHGNLWTVPGGAHLLLAVVGYNFARFQLGRGGVETLRSGVGSLVQLALPCMVWIGAVALVIGTYEPGTVFFLNGLVGSDQWTVQWQFWFLEAIIWTQLIALAALAIPWLHRTERRSPFMFAMAVLVGSLAVRYAVTGVEAGATERYTPLIVLWCFMLGWVVAVARTHLQRAAVSVLAAVATVGFFDDLLREGVIVAGILLLIWVPAVRMPRSASRAVGIIAAASLYIYLTHWQIYPYLEDRVPALAVLASIAMGLAYQFAWKGLVDRMRNLRALFQARTFAAVS